MKTSNTITIVLTLFAFTLTFAHNELNHPSELSVHVLSITAPTCNGGNNGSIQVEAFGGKAPYTYLWNTFPNQHTAEAVELTAGIYFIYITDANDSTYSRSIEIEDPTQSTIITDNSIASELKCTVSGLNAPYTLKLDGVELNSEDAAFTYNNGIHQLKIIDANGCEAIQYIQFVESVSKEIVNEEIIQIEKTSSLITSQLIPTITNPKPDFYNTEHLAAADR